MGQRSALRLEPLVWEGAPLTAVPDGWRAACTATSCARHDFTLAFEPGYWDAREGGVQVVIAWGGHERVDFDLEVLGPDGGSLGVAWGEYAAVVFLEKPDPGAYAAVVKATSRGGGYLGAVQVDVRPPPPAEPRDLLPNLVALRPKDLSLHANNYFLNGELGPHKGTVYEHAGLRNCGLDEAVEAQAKRCLRFASAVGNRGEGPLEVRLVYPAGAAAAVGEGQFVQRVHRSDGSHAEVPVGKAVYHATHRHLHYTGLATFQLFAYDPATQARGDPMGEGRKAGFCMVDEGLVDFPRAGTRPPGYDGAGCSFLLDWENRPQEESFMGISPGWFDMYEVDRPDQFVDVSAVPDGVYELVAFADGGGTLVESDDGDNEASVVFRMTGDAIEVLGGSGPAGPFGAEGYARG